MSFQFTKDPATEKALRHSLRDGIAYSVMSGAGETYFSAFALYFKATTAQIGLLASLPALISSIAQLFSAWLSHKGPTRREVILFGASTQALIWLPLLLLPMLFPEFSVVLVIGCIVLFHAAGSLVVPQWSSLMGDLVPERRRGRYFAMRTRYTSFTVFFALIFGGLVLYEFEKYDLAIYGFVCIFGIAALARCVSVYHLTFLYEPGHDSPMLEIPFSHHWWRQLKDAQFVPFSVFFACMQTAVAIGSPFFAVFMLRDLQFTYVEFMLMSAATVMMQFLTLNTWGRISDVFGNRLILFIAGFAIPLIPLLWLFSHNFWYLIGVQMLGGLVWAGFNLSSGNFLYDLIPAPQRATFLAFHNVITNIGVFFGALLGGYLGIALPATVSLNGSTYSWSSALLGVFLLSSIARMAVALLFLPRLKEVRAVRPISVTELIFRATRYSAFMGLLYDIIGSSKSAHKGKNDFD